MPDHKPTAPLGLLGRPVPVALVVVDVVVDVVVGASPPLPAVLSLPVRVSVGAAVVVGPPSLPPLRVLPVREARLVADAGVEKLRVLDTELK